LEDAEALQTESVWKQRQIKERWKYTRQNKVRDLLATLTPQAAEAATTSKLATALPTNLIAEDPAAALALQQLGCVEEISLSQGEKYVLPDNGDFRALMINVEPGAVVQLDEVHTYLSDFARLVFINVQENGALIHSRNCFSSTSQWHFLNVTLEKNSQYTLHNHASGSTLCRQDIIINLQGTRAHAELQGSAVVGQGLHLDQQIRLSHLAPDASSNQVFHTIAEDRAKVTFGGRIHIHPSCDGTDARLQNKNLALGDNVTINTKPELEIYSEDVSCAHGATVGQLDPAHEFYCTSRGIEPEAARTLLSQAFIGSATNGPLAAAAQLQYQSSPR
jgi:Fe-S cluster assembly scaffold protein SufB